MRGNDVKRPKDLDVPWDEVREQRVLARVLAERRRPGSPRLRIAAVPVAVIAVAAAILLAILVPWRRLTDSAPPVVASSAAPTEDRAAHEQVMGLPDGSRAILVQDAGLQIEEHRADAVRIQQQRGTVIYDVRPDPKREFTVRAANNTIRVRGTTFTVAMSANHVEVSVLKGRVEVDDGARMRELSAGESLQVPIRVPVPGPSLVLREEPRPGVEPAAHEPKGATATELQARADAARIGGRLDEAVSSLERLVTMYPRDARVPGALFSLGRVERSRHRDAAAARAFERCLRAAPDGPLAEDAQAEAAASWAASGNATAARRHASGYVARHPNGAQTARMNAILTP